jgi:hypothetical protein
VLRREKLRLLVLLGLVTVLAMHVPRLVVEQRYQASVRKILATAITQRPEARLIEVLFSQADDGRITVSAVVRSPSRFSAAGVGALVRSLPPLPDGSAPRLLLRHVEIDVEATAK